MRCWPRGGLWLGEGRQGACFPSCGQLGGHVRIHTRTHTHTHTHMHSLSCSLHLGGPCLLMGPVGLSAGGDSQPQGQQEMGRRVGSQEEGGEGLLRFQEAGRPGLVLAGPGGLSLPHLGSGVCGHSWVRLPSSLLVLMYWVSAGGVFLGPINAWARAPPPPTPQAGYDKGQWGHLE